MLINWPDTPFPQSSQDDGSGVFGIFVVVFILFVIAGIVLSVVQHQRTKELMRSRGATEREASTVAWFGGENAVVAAALLPKPAPEQSGAPAPQRSAADRLADLQGMHDRGLITEAEFSAKRSEILGQL